MKKVIFVALILAMLLLPSIAQASGPQIQCFGGGWDEESGSYLPFVCRVIDYDLGIVCYIYKIGNNSPMSCVKIG